MKRVHLLTASALVSGVFLAAGPARAETEYPYCSTEGVSMGQDCSFETLDQCKAATKGVGTYCFRNPRYKEPVVVAPPPAPIPAPAATKKQPRLKKTAPAGTKS